MNGGGSEGCLIVLHGQPETLSPSMHVCGVDVTLFESMWHGYNCSEIMLGVVDIGYATDIFIVATSQCLKYIKTPESQTELQSLK